MNPPPIQWIPVFEVSARFKNFRKAAEYLNVSPPAVSQQIKALEQHLGIKLFLRNGPRLSLTEAGEFYYQLAKKTMDAHVGGFNEFDRRFNKKSLRLNTPLFIAQEILIPNYLGYKELEPKAELRITTGTEYIDFDSGTADAAIRFGLGDWTSLTSKLLCPIQTSPVCSPSYYEQHLASQTGNLEELLDNQVWISTNENIREWSTIFPDITPRDIIICDSYFSAIKSAEKGLGIVLGIFPAINNWVNEGRITLIDRKQFDTKAAYWLVYPKQQEENELIRSCHIWSKKLFNELPPLL